MKHALKGHHKAVAVGRVTSLQGKRFVVRSVPRGVAPG